MLFARYPVLTLETWAAALGGPPAAARARDRARYYCRTGRLRRLAQGLYAVVSPGADPAAFSPDPYLVAAVLRDDALLSHHTALDLLGVARSVFNRFTYFTARVRRPLRLDSVEWHALAHPRPLDRAGQARFGVTRIDRHGVILEVTGPERTLVDGFSSLRWVGGLEEHVESSVASKNTSSRRRGFAIWISTCSRPISAFSGGPASTVRSAGFSTRTRRPAIRPSECCRHSRTRRRARHAIWARGDGARRCFPAGMCWFLPIWRPRVSPRGPWRDPESRNAGGAAAGNRVRSPAARDRDPSARPPGRRPA